MLAARIHWGLPAVPPRSKAEREIDFRLPHLVEDEPLDLPLPPPAPERLSPAMRAWWSSVTHTYVLEPHHTLLLEAACDAWDTMTQARETLRREGLTVSTGAGGTKKNPAVDIELHNKITFARLVRELDLDVEMPKQDWHNWPPKMKSNRIR
jgi:P27 family predicted phage terminase small subunit